MLVRSFRLDPDDYNNFDPFESPLKARAYDCAMEILNEGLADGAEGNNHDSPVSWSNSFIGYVEDRDAWVNKVVAIADKHGFDVLPPEFFNDGETGLTFVDQSSSIRE